MTDIVRETGVKPGRPSTYPHLFGDRAVLQVAFNVLLTIPFGLFLRYYFRTHWIRCLLLSFGLSLSFETTQVTGIFGIFDYPYRLFDVDDLITNTAGGMLGYVAAEWFASRLPRIDRLDAEVDLTPPLILIPYAVGLFAMNVWLGMHLIRFVLGRRRVPFHDRWSGTRQVVR